MAVANMTKTARFWSQSTITSFGAVIPLVVLILVLAVASPYFLTAVNIRNILLQSAILGVLAFGLTVTLIAEEIDLSLGAVEGLTAVLAGIICIELQWPWPVSVVVVVASGFIIGFLNGVLTTRLGIPSFITTLGTMGIASGVALRLTDGNSISGFPESYVLIGRSSVLGLPLPTLVAGVLLLAIWFLLRWTRTGLRLYAVGGNPSAAAELGLSPAKLKTLALAISGACAGVAGVLISARLNSANGTLGQFDLLDAIAAVVIGGTSLTGGRGSVIGTLFGILIMVTIRNGLDLMGVSPFWQTAAVGAMILVAAVLHKLAARLGNA